ncbi:MAG: DUF3048 domain-containing protein [Candidatus Magasanikbacteria bacterium]|nr:DUF3048 domain-containing protein [Candidatus Magasanikbacteria bacterium]
MKKTNDKLVVTISLTLILVCSAILGLILFWDQVTKDAENKAATTANQFYLYQNNLNGAGEDVSTANDPVIAVMVDNHVDARPLQAGIAEARVVYEAPVEGNFTRYMALFSMDDASELVGPVRSARPYFIDWASEYSAFYLHSGGSPAALDMLKNNPASVYDVNEFWNGLYFWRDLKINAPHNLFTNAENWQSLVAEADGVAPAWRGWQFETIRAVDSAVRRPSVLVSSYAVPNGIIIPYNKNYEIVWQYDATSSLFRRLINGERERDASGQEIMASTIIIQRTNIKTIDSEGRKKVTTVGEGEASVISLGRKLDGRWQKSAGGRTFFYNNGGEEVIFAAGPARNASHSDAGGTIWIEVVPLELVVKAVE